MENNRSKQIHNIYEESKKLAETPMELSEIDDKTEREFYIAIRNFFIQSKRGAIEEGGSTMEEQVMMKMIIRFDEEKLNEHGYSLEKIYQYLNNMMLRRNLTVCEDGVYTDSGDEYNDTFSFMVIAPVISHNEWIKYAKEWLWYEGSDVPNNLLKTFEIAV